MHLAQFNVARLRAPLDDPSMRGFVDGLAPINALADGSPGFVWRLQDDSGDSTAERPYPDDPEVVITLSVWESVEAVREFVYRSHHVDYLRQRSSWFEPMQGYTLVLWWIPAGTLPTIEEAKQRLEKLRDTGPTPEAFTFRRAFPPPGGEKSQAADRAAHGEPTRSENPGSPEPATR
ncbi:MAG: DUF3291 domain-containing protein [Acidobacteria bacterium]|nr:MAG: DUF3291 domain-containing protein [Acidobacteriota bacterium]REK06159.1 MAG: DUF3291 domain-containing protein [Acidobacteriota bacterium]